MIDRDEIRKACEAATPGPWTRSGYRVEAPGDKSWVERFRITNVVRTDEPAMRDATFIASAREWVPALLAENEELREALVVLRNAVWVVSADEVSWDQVRARVDLALGGDA